MVLELPLKQRLPSLWRFFTGRSQKNENGKYSKTLDFLDSQAENLLGLTNLLAVSIQVATGTWLVTHRPKKPTIYRRPTPFVRFFKPYFDLVIFRTGFAPV